MKQKLWTALDRYVEEMLVGEDELLAAALKDSKETGLPAIHVSPAQGKYLYLTARMIRARRILEIGTLGGYSTIWLARALPEDGRLITLEYEPKHAEVARRNIVRAGLERVVEVRVGPAQDTLAEMIRTGVEPFDLIFIDADKESYPEYLQYGLRLSRPGTVMIADNVVRDGEVANRKARDPRVKAVREMLEIMANEPRVSATVLQTVGVKGYDGFAVAVVG